MREFIKNETLSFILPTISSKDYSKDFFINKYFVGAFVGDVCRYEYDNELLLVYKIERTLDFFKFDTKMIAHPNYAGISYDYDEKEVVVYVFKVPDEFHESYDRVMEGRYSLIDSNHKLNIVKFWNAENSETSKVYKILYRPDKMDEYWSNKGINSNDICYENEKWMPPVLELELFDISNI